MRWSPARAIPLLLTLLLALGGPAAVASAETAADNPDAASLIQVGSEPVPFSLQTPDGDVVELADFEGEAAVLLTFWSFFCGPCREEIPLLDEFVKKYAADGFEMLAISLDGPKMEKPIRKYMTSNDYSFQVLWEEIDGVAYKTADSYGVVGTPSLILIDREGTVSWTHVGREKAPVIEAEIRKAIGLD